MAVQVLHQDSFTSGELSPALAARPSLQRWGRGVTLAENMLVEPQGALVRRPGTQYVRTVTDTTRAIPFVFAIDEAVLLLVDDSTITFLDDGEALATTTVATTVTNGDFATGDLTGWTDISTAPATAAVSGGVAVLTGGANGASQLTAGIRQAITVAAGDRGKAHTLAFTVSSPIHPGPFTIRIGTTTTGTEIFFDPTFVTGKHVITFTAPAGVGTIYLTFEWRQPWPLHIDDVRFVVTDTLTMPTPFWPITDYAQSVNTLFMTNPAYRPVRLRRRAELSWSLEDMFLPEGPFEPQVTSTQTTISIATATYPSTATVTLSSTVDLNGGRGFMASDVGRLFATQRNIDYAEVYFVIIAVGSTTTATLASLFNLPAEYGARNEPFPSTGSQLGWRIGLFGSEVGWPTYVSIVQERLIFAAVATDPRLMLFSKSGLYQNFGPTTYVAPATSTSVAEQTTDADAFSLIVRAPLSSIIAGSFVFVMTSEGPAIIRSAGLALTPTDRVISYLSGPPASDIKALIVNDSLLYVDRSGRRLMEIKYDLAGAQTLVARDLLITAAHRVGAARTITELDVLYTPWQMLIMRLSDGTCITTTFEPDYEVLGTSLGIKLDGTVVDVATIPDVDTARTELFMIVRRDDVYTLERLTPVFVLPRRVEYATDDAWRTAVIAAQTAAVTVDGAVTYAGTATALDGLDHLDDMDVATVIDGVDTGDDVAVVSGEITLPYAPVATTHVGLRFKHRAQTVKWPTDSQRGSGYGMPGQITHVQFIVDGAARLRFGQPGMPLQPDVPLNVAAPVAGDPPELYAGVTPNYAVSYERAFGCDLYLEDDAAVPFSLLGLIVRLNVDDKS